MKVKDLKKILRDCPDEMEVVLRGIERGNCDSVPLDHKGFGLYESVYNWSGNFYSVADDFGDVSIEYEKQIIRLKEGEKNDSDRKAAIIFDAIDIG